MMRVINAMALGIVTTAVLGMAGCHGSFGSASAEKKEVLWNGEDFTGWVRFVPDATVDVNDVWRIRGNAIYCKGQPNGYMRTEKKYKNYHLHVEWRWPEEPTNSGVLLHAQGPEQVWPVCIECQLQAGNAGDFVLIGGPGITVDGVDRQNVDKQFVVIDKMAPTSEKPAGQWNSYDINCKGGSISCYVNGVLQNEGTKATLKSGWICLQSEGSPIEFRNIYIVPVE